MVPINFRNIIQKASYAISPKEIITKAKLAAAVIGQVPKAMLAIGFKGYAKSRDLQKKVQNLITRIIPTEIDNKILQFDQKVEDTYIAPILNNVADRIWDSIQGNSAIMNAHLEAKMAEQENDIRRKTYVQGKKTNKTEKAKETFTSKRKENTIGKNNKNTFTSIKEAQKRHKALQERLNGEKEQGEIP